MAEINLEAMERAVNAEKIGGYRTMPVSVEVMERLLSHVRELEQDAARYRWLRSGALGSSRVFMNAPVGKLDDWIDAAMAASAKGGKE